MRWVALVTAAGSSVRLGGTKKEWLPLGQGTVISASVAPFLAHPDCAAVVVTHPPGERERMAAALGQDSVLLCPGGDTRARSIGHGLEFVASLGLLPDYVLVHDGARPWLSAQLLQRILAALVERAAVIPVLPCHEALKELTDDGERVLRHHPRQRFVNVQTPQAFPFQPLLNCYRQALENPESMQAADDAQLWQDSGGSVYTVKGDRCNVKITYPEDLSVLHSRVLTPIQQRCGQGYDVHRLEPGSPLVLGGIKIECGFKSVAHSDGDVLLHALIDAMLGAAALGDVGMLFPDTDPRYAGCDSADLLLQAGAAFTSAGWELVNLDATVMLERPKLAPYRCAIRTRIAQLLDLPLEAVSLKAKTAEGLDAVGRGEALAAWVSVLAQRRAHSGR